MITEIENNIVDKILTDLENDLCNVVKYFPLDHREELKQSIRLRIWRFMNESSNELINHEYEFVLYECKVRVYTYAILSSKSILRDRNKYNKRHSNIEDFCLQIVDEHTNMEFSIDAKKYKPILSGREYKILEYLIEIGSNFKNFDMISRQLGYTGKNAAKYNLVNMANKILEFNQENDKI